MKIGLVTPYIYPLPGGVNAHVHDLYEHLVAHGHDVRIISSVHGAQRQSEGDIIRLGYGFSVPTNGSVGTLIWETGEPAYFKVSIEPNEARWGTYAVQLPLPLKSDDDAAAYLEALLPELRGRWQRWAERS